MRRHGNSWDGCPEFPLLLQLRVRERLEEFLVIAQIEKELHLVLRQVAQWHVALELLQQIEHLANPLDARGLDEGSDLAARHLVCQCVMDRTEVAICPATAAGDFARWAQIMLREVRSANF